MSTNFKGSRTAIIEPSLPYVYIPNSDFLTLIEHMAITYQKQFRCSYNDKICYSDSPCDRSRNVMFDFELGTEAHQKYSVKMNVYDFFVNGGKVGMSDNQCVLGIFPVEDGSQDIWYLGNIFMQNHYTVFDMSPYTALGNDFLVIGLAKPNPLNPLLESKRDNQNNNNQ
jgi:hypothetical protein